jgi:hypothetical protein
MVGLSLYASPWVNGTAVAIGAIAIPVHALFNRCLDSDGTSQCTGIVAWMSLMFVDFEFYFAEGFVKCHLWYIRKSQSWFFWLS